MTASMRHILGKGTDLIGWDGSTELKSELFAIFFLLKCIYLQFYMNMHLMCWAPE